jgi:DNA polymerase-3 subunit delta'
MDFPKYFNPKNSLQLFGLKQNFNFLSSLYLKDKLPKVFMISGLKGSGKSTLINHFLFSIFDERNYKKTSYTLSNSSALYKKFQDGIFQNILYLKGSDFKSLKVDDIRNLKSIILKSSMFNKDRFIILDDIELFNTNSLNALLKVIEEPSKRNYFVLINNKTKPIIDTIKSRSIEIKINLNENERVRIIKKLIKHHNIETILDPDLSKLTPGNFLKFNFAFNEYDLSIKNDFTDNLSKLLNLHKKNKDILFIDILFYLSDFYFKNLKDQDILKNDKIYELRSFVLDNLNKYFTFNLNQNSLINAIDNKLKYG